MSSPPHGLLLCWLLRMRTTFFPPEDLVGKWFLFAMWTTVHLKFLWNQTSESPGEGPYSPLVCEANKPVRKLKFSRAVVETFPASTWALILPKKFNIRQTINSGTTAAHRTLEDYSVGASGHILSTFFLDPSMGCRWYLKFGSSATEPRMHCI